MTACPAFEQFPDKDVLLVRLPDGCSRPAIATGFRSIRADAHTTTVSRITRALEHQASHGHGRKDSSLLALPHRKGHSLAASSARNVVLYAFHRDELPYLNVGGAYLFDVDDEDVIRDAAPVVVKGLGVRGIGRVVKVWGSRCLSFITGSSTKRASTTSKGRSATMS